MSTFNIRLRKPLELRSRQQRELETLTGIVMPPIVIPARTTLRVTDLFTSGAYCLTPSGQRVLVSLETCKQHAYIPRAKA